MKIEPHGQHHFLWDASISSLSISNQSKGFYFWFLWLEKLQTVLEPRYTLWFTEVHVKDMLLIEGKVEEIGQNCVKTHLLDLKSEH